jgi:hypothetical protein
MNPPRIGRLMVINNSMYYYYDDDNNRLTIYTNYNI